MAGALSTSQESGGSRVPLKKLNDAVYELYRPATGHAELEIVYFHGFQVQSDAHLRTWMTADGSACWIKTWLSHSFPRSRIYSVSYNSSAETQETTGSMNVLGKHLAYSLIERLKVGQSCPVLFVGHGIGGLVMKQVCIQSYQKGTSLEGTRIIPYATFLEYIRGFFYARRYLGFEKVDGVGKEGSLIEYLNVYSKMTKRINKEFSRLRLLYQWRLMGVIEGSETSHCKATVPASGGHKLPAYVNRVGVDFTQGICRSYLTDLVDKSSAIFDSEDFLSLPGDDYFTICKPRNQYSFSSRLLVTVVQIVLQEANNEKERLHRKLDFPGVYVEVYKRAHDIIQILQLDTLNEEPFRLALVGQKGIGKTSLAKEVVVKIRTRFDYVCFIGDASRRLPHRSLSKLIASNLFHGHTGRQVPSRVVLGKRSLWVDLKERKVLMIIDDVNAKDQIRPLLYSNWCAKGSLLIITSCTQRQEMASHFVTYEVPPLASRQAKDVLLAYVKKDVRRKISADLIETVVKKCQGVPSSLEAVGTSLHYEKDESTWKAVLTSLARGEFFSGTQTDNDGRRSTLGVRFDAPADMELHHICMRNLKTLRIHDKNMTHLPETRFHTLLLLCLEYPRLQTLPLSIMELFQLSSLELINCSTLKELPNFGQLGQLRSLEELDFFECHGLTELPVGIVELPSVLPGTFRYSISAEDHDHKPLQFMLWHAMLYAHSRSSPLENSLQGRNSEADRRQLQVDGTSFLHSEQNLKTASESDVIPSFEGLKVLRTSECSFHPLKKDKFMWEPTSTSTAAEVCGSNSSLLIDSSVDGNHGSLRPDVIALGFARFDESFDTKKILCIYTELENDDAVELMFFHVEGMAAICGIGLPFSKVTLSKTGELEIRDVGERVWVQSWLASSVQYGNLVLFYEQLYESATQPSNSFTTVELSAQDAAALFGVGVEGMSYLQPATPLRDCKPSARGKYHFNDIISPQDWMRSLFRLLKGKFDFTSSSLESMGDPKMSGCEVMMTLGARELVGSFSGSTAEGSDQANLSPHIVCEGSLVNQAKVADSNQYNEYRRKQLTKLTVIITWITNSLEFYCHCPEGHKLLLQDTASRSPKLFDPITHTVITGGRNILDCELTPTVAVEFSFESDQNEGSRDGNKKFTTTLDANFHNACCASQEQEFGWYHDNLRLSFRCKEHGTVKREIQDLDVEVRSKLELCDNRGEYGEEASNSSTKTTGQSLRLSGGMTSVASLHGGLTAEQKRSASITARQSFSNQVWVNRLKEANFSVHREEKRCELGYTARLFPPFLCYDVTSSLGREAAFRSGMMSTVPIKISGDWLVLEDDTGIVPRFCAYEFRCERDLFLLQRDTDMSAEQINYGRRSRIQFRKGKQVALDVDQHASYLHMKEEKVRQKLGRDFTMNHSFTHMRRFRRPQPYTWVIKDQSGAPSSVRGIIC